VSHTPPIGRRLTRTRSGSITTTAPASNAALTTSRLAKREDRSEVGILREEDPLLIRRQLEGFVVGSSREAEIADMDGVVPRIPKALGQAGDNALSTRNLTPWVEGGGPVHPRLRRHNGVPRGCPPFRDPDTP